MQLIDAIILGLIEGLTEYIPVSSTGHLIIASALLGLDHPPQTKAAVDAFIIVIQGGAILAVLGLYWRRVRQMLVGLLGREPVGRRLLINLVIAFLPAAIVGLLLDSLVDLEAVLFRTGPVMGALALGGLVMILLTPWQRRFFHGQGSEEPDEVHSFVDIDHLTWRRALLIGMIQCLAMWPGTSRSMVTIVGGMVVGMRPKHAAEFSFLLGLPTLGAACVYKAAENMLGEGPNMFVVLGAGELIVGMIVATIAAALAVKWLVSYLGRHDVALFGWYRLALCALLGILIWQGVVPNLGAETPEPPAAVP